MANNEFKKIEEFIQRFSIANTLEEGAIWGIEFSYKNKYYRITRNQSGDDNFTNLIKNKFNKPNGDIEFYYLPIKRYPDHYKLTENIYIGIYDDINDLLNNGKIGRLTLREILVSKDTKILGID